MADKLKQMHRKKILLMGGILMVALVAGLCVQKPEGIKPTPIQPAEELKLSDFPEAFKDSTLIVVGDNASVVEMQAVNEIADYLENETGNKPLIKKHSAISDEDKRNYNLIVVGTPKTNPLLEEVNALTNATRVTEEFPGEGKGVLEILPNPWDESKVMLLVEGWDKNSVFGDKIMLLNMTLPEDTLEIVKPITVMGTVIYEPFMPSSEPVWKLKSENKTYILQLDKTHEKQIKKMNEGVKVKIFGYLITTERGYPEWGGFSTVQYEEIYVLNITFLGGDKK